jgi:hypothetical protein
MQPMVGTSDRRPALWADRLFHCTTTLRESQLFDFRRTNTGHSRLRLQRCVHFRNCKSVPYVLERQTVIVPQ